MSDARLVLIVNKWICNTSINCMRFAEDPTELTDLPLVHLRIIRDHYTASDTDSVHTITSLIRDKERAFNELQSKKQGAGVAGPGAAGKAAAPSASAGTDKENASGP